MVKKDLRSFLKSVDESSVSCGHYGVNLFSSLTVHFSSKQKFLRFKI